MKNKNYEAKTLYELYSRLGLSIKNIQSVESFTIHNLRDTGFTLPYQSPSFRPDYFSFLFIKNGMGKYTIDDHAFDVFSRSIYFTNPSNYRTFSWTAIEDIYLITFDEDFLKRYVTSHIFEEFPFLLNDIIGPKVIDDNFYAIVAGLVSDMEKEYVKETAEKFKIIGLFLGVLLHRVKEVFWQEECSVHKETRSSQIVKTFKATLDRHYSDIIDGKTKETWGLKEYANMQRLHPHYFSTVIKNQTDKTVSYWITEKRIRTARLLLMKSNFSIKMIAFRLGFSDVSHFSNFFKKNVSISPTEYRKQYKSRLF
ncbi:MAG: AraC family transcriptional regulator [Sphingobacterium sp.]|jgi:AraC-like DNA-binding protein|nr:AraC family transcriptional regulator [Sphingobacterium sp.]